MLWFRIVYGPNFFKTFHFFILFNAAADLLDLNPNNFYY